MRHPKDAVEELRGLTLQQARRHYYVLKPMVCDSDGYYKRVEKARHYAGEHQNWRHLMNYETWSIMLHMVAFPNEWHAARAVLRMSAAEPPIERYAMPNIRALKK